MNEIDLVVEVTVARDAGGRDETTSLHRRAFRLPLRKAGVAQGWGTQHFNRALSVAEGDEVVRVEITGTSEDASHPLALGHMFGWLGKVRARRGVFEKKSPGMC